MPNHRLVLAISDIGFYKLKEKLMYKAREYRRNIVEADRFYPSTKNCSHCGYIRKDITLKGRVYECPDCGTVIDMDLNAAINRSKHHRESYSRIKACGADSSEREFYKKLSFSQQC